MDNEKLLENFDKLDLANRFFGQMEKRFPKYVIYTKQNRYRATAYCTACHKNYTITDGSGDFDELLLSDIYLGIGEVKHNAHGTCRACGAEVMFQSKGRLHINRNSKQNFAIFLSISKDGKILSFSQLLTLCLVTPS